MASSQRPSDPMSRLAGAVMLTVTLLLAACSSQGESISGWVSSDEAAAVFLRWTQTGDSLSGTLRVAELRGEQVDATDATFTGTISGGDVSVTVGGFLGDRTLTGTITRERLTLLFPDPGGGLVPVEFRPGSVEEFNQLVNALSAEAQEQQIRREETDAIEAAYRELDAATQRLSEALNEANTRSMSEAVTTAERLLDEDVEAAIAILEAEADNADEREFGRDDVLFALDDVGFALDDVGFAVEDARGLFGAETVRSALTSLQDRSAAVRRADAEVRSLSGGTTDPQIDSLLDRVDRQHEQVETELEELNNRLGRIDEQAQLRWEYAVSIAESAGVEVGDHSGFGRQ